MTDITEISKRTGRRKTSVAQVKLQEGDGKITVNSVPLSEYFRGCERYQKLVTSPVTLVESGSKYDYTLKVNGGGIASQAGAARHAIARALGDMSDEIHAAMKRAGFLTRDARMVERKKPGQPKARRRFQYSKR
ncbi:MAG: 30S ribosomal protein S9 [Elusimicrobiaceae bacterium]|jgi:small subunit ribosomal protein S9